MRLLPLSLSVVIVLGALPARAEERTDPKPEESVTMWPAHVAGAVGILGLGTALAFGSLQMNADHSARVAEASLAKAGASPGACNADPLRADLAQMCWLVDRHENARDFHEDAFTVALSVGLTSLAFAVTWYLLAK